NFLRIGNHGDLFPFFDPRVILGAPYSAAHAQTKQRCEPTHGRAQSGQPSPPRNHAALSRDRPRRSGDPERAMTEPTPLWRRLLAGWMAIAEHFGSVQTLVLLGVIYVFVIGPVSLIQA